MPRMSRVKSSSNRQPVEGSQNGFVMPDSCQQFATALCAAGKECLSKITDESFAVKGVRRDSGADSFQLGERQVNMILATKEAEVNSFQQSKEEFGNNFKHIYYQTLF